VIEYYIDPITGNDNNSGYTKEQSKQDLQNLFNLLSMRTDTVTIYLESGKYPSNYIISSSCQHINIKPIYFSSDTPACLFFGNITSNTNLDIYNIVIVLKVGAHLFEPKKPHRPFFHIISNASVYLTYNHIYDTETFNSRIP